MLKNFYLNQGFYDVQISTSYAKLIEEYDFEEIRNKYYLDDSIISLFFKNKNEIRILSRISIKENVILKNQSFKNIDISDTSKIKDIINFLNFDMENTVERGYDSTTATNHVLGADVKLITAADADLIEFGDNFGFDGF